MFNTNNILKVVFKEITEVFDTIVSNVLCLVKYFWRQSWKKKSVDITFGIILCLIPLIGMTAFSSSMMMNLENLDTIQSAMYSFIITSVSLILYFNFAELFILFSLGGIAIFNNECYEAIRRRMNEFN